MSIKSQLLDSSVLKARIAESMIPKISRMCTVILASLKKGNKVMFCGNGGSAGDAQHLAGEFINQFRFPRAPLPGLALTTDSSVLTCIGNDSSFDHVFSKQVKALGKKGDVLIAISTSGNSKNIIEACRAAKEKGIYIIGLTGETGGNMKGIVNCLINVPSTDTPRIQEAHITIGHIICLLVEKELFG